MGREPDTTGAEIVGSLADISGSGWAYFELKQAAKAGAVAIPVVGPNILGAGLFSSKGAASVKSMNEAQERPMAKQLEQPWQQA